jgi:hypothetical protein
MEGEAMSDLPEKDPFDDRRLLVVADLRVQSRQLPEWHMVERKIRELNPLTIWAEDCYKVRVEDVVPHTSITDMLKEIERIGPDKLTERLRQEQRRRVGTGWAVAINRWQTVWA